MHAINDSSLRRPRAWGFVFAASLAVSLATASAVAQSSGSLLNRSRTMLKPAAKSKLPTSTARPSSSSSKQTSSASTRQSSPGASAGGKATTAAGSSTQTSGNGTADATARARAVANGAGSTSDAASSASPSSASGDSDTPAFERGVFRPADPVIKLADGGTAEVGAILDMSKAPPPDRRQAVADRLSSTPASNLSDPARAFVDRTTAAQAAKRDADENVARVTASLTDQHYMQVQLDNDHAAMIKGADWGVINRAADELRKKYNMQPAKTMTPGGWGEPVPAFDVDHPERYQGYSDPVFEHGVVYDSDRMAHEDERIVRAVPFRCSSRPVRENTPAVTEPATPSGDDPPVSPADAAFAALRDDSTRPTAVAAFKSLVETSPEDAELRRGYGLALLAAGKTADGAAELYAAYKAEPALVRSPLEADVLGDAAELRDVAQRLVTLAGRTNDPAPSIAAAALFQAQGKPDAAAKVIERASRKNIDDRLAMEYSLQLSSTR